MTAFYHFFAAEFLKFLHASGKCEFTVLVAIAAIHQVNGSVGVGAATFGVFCHWHAAALAVFVCIAHIFYYFGLLVFCSCAIQIINCYLSITYHNLFRLSHLPV
jgi:hypothetical protein